MFKQFLLLLSLILLPVMGRAEPFVSPDGCLAIAQEVYIIAQVRDIGVLEEEVLKTIPEEDKVAYAFYSYWVKFIYAQSKGSDIIARSFYESCLRERGDISKLYGLEV